MGVICVSHTIGARAGVATGLRAASGTNVTGVNAGGAVGLLCMRAFKAPPMRRMSVGVLRPTTGRHTQRQGAARDVHNPVVQHCGRLPRHVTLWTRAVLLAPTDRRVPCDLVRVIAREPDTRHERRTSLGVRVHQPLRPLWVKGPAVKDEGGLEVIPDRSRPAVPQTVSGRTRLLHLGEAPEGCASRPRS